MSPCEGDGDIEQERAGEVGGAHIKGAYNEKVTRLMTSEYLTVVIHWKVLVCRIHLFSP